MVHKWLISCHFCKNSFTFLSFFFKVYLSVCRLSHSRKPPVALVVSNSTDEARWRGLFVDLQTDLQWTPPLPLHTGEAAGCGFFTDRGRGQLWDRKHSQISLVGSTISLSRIYRGKNTMEAANIRLNSQLEIPEAYSNNLSIYTQHPWTFTFVQSEFTSSNKS